MQEQNPHVAFAKQFLDESNLLLGMVEALNQLLEVSEDGKDTADQRDVVASHLVELHEQVQKVFSMEEGKRGLFEDILDQRPTEDRFLGMLKEEHESILNQCNLLSSKLRSTEKLDLAQIRQALHTMLSFLREHENKENKLIELVYFVDEGGG